MCFSSMGMLSVVEPSVNLETRGVQNSTAADGQHPFGGTERRLNKDLRRVTGLIGFLIRDKRDLFLLHLAGWRLLPAADPAREAALVFASQFIRHNGGDLITSTDGSLKGTGARLGRGELRAGLNINHLLRPIRL